MDLSQSFNLNTAPENPLFNPTFLNLEYLFNRVLDFFYWFYSIFTYGEFALFLKIIFFALVAFFIIIMAYCAIRIFEIREKEREHLEREIAEYAHRQAERERALAGAEGKPRNERWENVLNYLSSVNPSDWKLAVMEADSMLEDLTDQLELEGENVGERLKAANKEKFNTLDNAWEAHIVRNRIAHEGAKFELHQREANRIVVLYENVFREFGII